MKKIKILAFLMLGMLSMTSCIDDDNDELTGNQNEGGLILLNTTNVAYVVGNDATYNVNGRVYQGNDQITSVAIYKTFTSSSTGSSSNEVLLTTIPITDTTVGTFQSFSYSFTYEDLIQGLTVDGAGIPTNDADLTIGDSWTFRYETTTADGRIFTNRTGTSISVGTRFAGTYAVIAHQYWRIGVLRDDVAWPDEMVVQSIDATTYRIDEYFGAFDGNELFFQIDENDVITYPATTPAGAAQTGNGEPFITCQSHPQELTHVNCSTSNYVQRDDVNGKDKLYMSFGYLTGNTSGNSREFYQVLEKIVD